MIAFHLVSLAGITLVARFGATACPYWWNTENPVATLAKSRRAQSLSLLSKASATEVVKVNLKL